MKTRIISGIILTAVTIAVTMAGGPVLSIALLACSLQGMFELMRALGVISDEAKINPLAIAAYAGAVLYYVLLICFGERYFGVMAAVIVIAVMAVYVVYFPKYSSSQATSAGFSFIYVAFLLSFIYLIRIEERGIYLVWLVFLSSWAADTAAYFTGMKIGKHKMTPVLSPKKTWEGAIGGILGGGICGLLFSVIFDDCRFPLQFFLICLIGSVISIFGDLAASAIKRESGLKDYGNIIPGHGGILDRFDSVIFIAPGIYFLTQIFTMK